MIRSFIYTPYVLEFSIIPYHFSCNHIIKFVHNIKNAFFKMQNTTYIIQYKCRKYRNIIDVVTTRFMTRHSSPFWTNLGKENIVRGIICLWTRGKHSPAVDTSAYSSWLVCPSHVILIDDP
jgi:hypothetical protein